ncbi:MAG: hypothetical protein ACXADO_13365 [Candidatus Thorarchaeota archaeon]|jgi:hypothetical protein
MKAKILTALAVIALVGTVGTAYALENGAISENIAEPPSDMEDEDFYANCHQWRHQHKPQYQWNKSDNNETQYQ